MARLGAKVLPRKRQVGLSLPQHSAILERKGASTHTAKDVHIVMRHGVGGGGRFQA